MLPCDVTGGAVGKDGGVKKIGRGNVGGQWYCGLGNASACDEGRTFELSEGRFADLRGLGDVDGESGGNTVAVRTETVFVQDGKATGFGGQATVSFLAGTPAGGGSLGVSTTGSLSCTASASTTGTTTPPSNDANAYRRVWGMKGFVVAAMGVVIVSIV